MAAILFDVDARGIATLTLNMPDRQNRLDSAALAEILAILDRCESDDAIRLLCIRAVGKHFCAGADIRDLRRGDDRTGGGQAQPAMPTMLRRLSVLRVPTAALVQGACVGGGAGIIACCDAVVAESDAFVSVSEVRLGIPPASIIPYFAAAIGRRQLRRYVLSGERIDADRCREIGFFHEVCAAGELSRTAAPIIDAFLRGGPAAMTSAKRFIDEAAPVALSLEREAELLAQFDEIVESPEAVEGIAAFLEKRAPAWYHAG